MSKDLDASDIAGAQAGTKGRGTFAGRQRAARDGISALDIHGAQAGTLKKGLGSKRVTDPMNPLYQALGRTQADLREDTVYAEPLKEQPVKKVNREKPEWKKSTVMPVIEDKKVNSSVAVEHPSPFPTAANVIRANKDRKR